MFIEIYFGVQRMLLPCGPPPEREDDWESSFKNNDVNLMYSVCWNVEFKLYVCCCTWMNGWNVNFWITDFVCRCAFISEQFQSELCMRLVWWSLVEKACLMRCGSYAMLVVKWIKKPRDLEKPGCGLLLVKHFIYTKINQMLLKVSKITTHIIYRMRQDQIIYQ